MNMIKDHNSYAIKMQTPLSHNEAISRVTETLAAEGFGILNSIDMQQTLLQKLGKQFGRYTILGACNPSFAFDALTSDMDLGLMMPCNVVVYTHPNNQQTIIAAVDPTSQINHSPTDLGAEPQMNDLPALVAKVKEKLSSAINAI